MIHLAGIDMQVANLLRQRCGWCGALLVDYDLSRIAVPLGQDPRPGVWPFGALVLVDGNMQSVIEYEPGAVLPEGTCTHLDPEVTR